MKKGECSKEGVEEDGRAASKSKSLRTFNEQYSIMYITFQFTGILAGKGLGYLEELPLRVVVEFM